MECDVCGATMKIGLALNSAMNENALYIAGPPVANHETIGFIEVAKCPECGRSLNEYELRDRGIDLRQIGEVK